MCAPRQRRWFKDDCKLELRPKIAYENLAVMSAHDDLEGSLASHMSGGVYDGDITLSSISTASLRLHLAQTLVKTLTEQTAFGDAHFETKASIV